ncbi:MAG TPA: DUF420 domain-containing protein [Candidatus Binatia bacterium]
MNDRFLRAAVAVVSVTVLSFLVWLLYVHPAASDGAGARSPLPVLNATFNFLCAACLVAGYRAIRAGNRRRHLVFMLAAVTCSAMFLVGYIVHHYRAGDTPFPGQGPVRSLYFTILATHVLATTIALPMILFTLAHAAAGRFVQHKKIARRTLPLWMYVSVTGVLVFAFLRWWS